MSIRPRLSSWPEVCCVFLTLGLSAFGGPVAHLGYFRRVFVAQRRWLTEAAYGELVALAQLLPGPASSQVGFAVGLRRAGLAGGLAAFAGFTAPSVAAMMLFAAYAERLARSPGGADAVHGLKLAAAAIVAQAVVGMARGLSRGWTRGLITLAAAICAWRVGGAAGQLIAIAAGAGVGLWRLEPAAPPAAAPPADSRDRRRGVVSLLVFAALLALCPLMAELDGAPQAFQAFYRSGALVFGGGHVVAPLLVEATVTPGWVSRDIFVQGYGLAQALPGPLFAFAAYLGAAGAPPLGGAGAAILATAAIFLPGLLLMAGALPFWNAICAAPRMRGALAGVNAAVVGILAAALYDPIAVTAIRSPADLAIAAAAAALLIVARAPPLAVVGLCVAAAMAIGLI